MKSAIGKIIAIRGVVVDVEFASENTPSVYEALTVNISPSNILTLEVEAILGDGKVRCVAMGTTYGLKRGSEVRANG